MRVEFKDLWLKRLTPSPQSEERVRVGLQKQLMVDDYVIAEKHNVIREVGKVKKHGIVMKPTLPSDFQSRVVCDGPDGGAGDPQHFGWFFSPHWDSSRQMFRMWYIGCKREGSGLAYAESKDGIHWQKPDLGIIAFQGNKKNNIVLRAVHGVGVIKDLHETDPQKRYKAIHPHRGHTNVWFSPDGLNWAQKKLPGLDHGDTYNCAFWDPVLKKYVLFTRNWGGTGAKGKRYGGGRYRRESRSESPDFLNWSKAKVVLEGLDTDMQIHDMPVFRHAGVYIGLVGLFDTVANRQHVELAWSPDSLQWHRICPGTPLIANSEQMGDYDWGCIFASPPILRKNEILLYYGANNGRFMGWRDGFFCLARLRPDGFAGYQQIAGGSNRAATITTKPVVAASGSLRLSADVVMSGYVKVTVLDKGNKELAESELIAQTVTDAKVRWKEGFSLEKLKGNEIRLQFELRDAKFYSFSFYE